MSQIHVAVDVDGNFPRSAYRYQLFCLKIEDGRLGFFYIVSLVRRVS